jgi:hypothetical protein
MAQTVIIYDSTKDETIALGVGYVDRLGALGVPVKGLRDLKYQLEVLRFQGVRIDQLIFVTHGSPGTLYLGDTGFLMARNMPYEVGGKGFEDLFMPDTQVMFDGCNIAETEPGCEHRSGKTAGRCSDMENGTVFLTTFVKTLLFKGGGRAGAWNSVGVAFGSFGTKIHHWWGTVLFAFISAGGSRIRLAAGRSELDSPQGLWRVHGFGEPRYYWFEQDGRVGWNSDILSYYRRDATGYGTWQVQDDLLYVDWGSLVGREWWDRPLFADYQTATASTEGGAYDLWAQEVRTYGGIF